MNSRQKRVDKQGKANARELKKLCDKMEKFCVPLHALLYRVVEEPPNVDVLKQLEQIQENLSIVNGGLCMVQERACSQEGGVNQRMAAQIIQRMRAVKPMGTRDELVAGMPTEGEPSLRGSSRVFPMVAVLRFLADQRKTGILSVGLRNETISLEVLEGNIVHVSCLPLRRGERLGEILIEAKDVRVEHFMAFVDTHRSGKGLLGMAMVESNVVSDEALTRALVTQMNARLDRVFGNDDCSFEFRDRPVQELTGLRISISDLLPASEPQNAEPQDAKPQDAEPQDSSQAPTPSEFGDRAKAPADVEQSALPRDWQGGSGDNDGWGPPSPL